MGVNPNQKRGRNIQENFADKFFLNFIFPHSADTGPETFFFNCNLARGNNVSTYTNMMMSTKRLKLS